MKINPKESWEQSLALIAQHVSPQQYNTWFKPLVFENYDEQTNTLLIQVPSPFFCEYLEGNFLSLLSQVLPRCFRPKLRLKYRVVTDKEHNLSQEIEADPADAVKPRGRKTTGLNQPQATLDAALQDLDPQLNLHQTFSNYIEGNSNKLPRSVGLSIAEHPNNMQFNPMFIYGPSGCGKTHLVNAIGVECKRLYPQKRVLYISARLFQVQYTNAVQANKVNDFINFYQTIDMLIVDDIQEWVTATSTQNTFFHIFNHLFRHGKRIMLASDRPPVDLQGMKDRLLTRFACGLIAELEKPNEELCAQILRTKIRHDGLSIPDDVVAFIAKTAKGSVRDLQGVINSLMAYSIVYNCKIDMRLADRVIRRAVKIDDSPLTVDDILESVCSHYNVTQEDINSKSRKRDYVVARQVSMYLAQKYTKMPAARIGKLVGNRDHSTVIHSCSQVEKRMKADKLFLAEMESIENSFKLKQ